jgi:hypothetical protein
MKRTISAVALLGVATLALAAAALTVDGVVKDRDKHDGKTVTVRGEVSEFRERTSRAGNKYTTFVLKGENSTINAYSRGALEKGPKNGDTIEITGQFRKEKKVNDNFTVRNEVDFSKSRENEKNGFKIIKRKGE